MKYIATFSIKKDELAKTPGLISRMWNQAHNFAERAGAKRRLDLVLLGGWLGKGDPEFLHFDLLETNSVLINDQLQIVSTATTLDGKPMATKDGHPVTTPKGKGEGRDRPSISEDPLGWYGEAYPSQEALREARNKLPISERIPKIEFVTVD